MKKTKVKYEVVYTPALATKTFEFMNKMDLGIVGGEYPMTYLYQWTTTSIIDSAYLSKMRKAIRKGLKANGVTQIHSLKRIR